MKLSKSAAIILCDIEGTTTSIDFVKETLFPYSINHAKEFLLENWGSPEVETAVRLLMEQSKEDVSNKVEGVVPTEKTTTTFNDSNNKDEIVEALYKNIEWQVRKDRKTRALKNFQGLVWEYGYKDGELKGHVYDDVPSAFERWTANGIKIYIYSSGSVAAQKILFLNSIKGNLLKFISGHYDTEIGAKQEPESYKNILDAVNCKPDEILFFTDVPKEAYAAKVSGIETVLLVRPGNVPLTDEDTTQFDFICGFDEIEINAIGK